MSIMDLHEYSDGKQSVYPRTSTFRTATATNTHACHVIAFVIQKVPFIISTVCLEKKSQVVLFIYIYIYIFLFASFFLIINITHILDSLCYNTSGYSQGSSPWSFFHLALRPRRGEDKQFGLEDKGKKV